VASGGYGRVFTAVGPASSGGGPTGRARFRVVSAGSAVPTSTAPPAPVDRRCPLRRFLARWPVAGSRRRSGAGSSLRCHQRPSSRFLALADAGPRSGVFAGRYSFCRRWRRRCFAVVPGRGRHAASLAGCQVARLARGIRGGQPAAGHLRSGRDHPPARPPRRPVRRDVGDGTGLDSQHGRRAGRAMAGRGRP